MNEQSIKENKFSLLGLSTPIVKALTTAGYTQPTAVQCRAIPPCLEGRDLLVSSPTGSGKTAAFILPAIQRLSSEAENRVGRRLFSLPARPRLLVLTPTRELAVQVSRASEIYGRDLRQLRTTSILGGVSYAQQIAWLKRDPEIIVATPGRLIDHLQRGRIDLSSLLMFVLDEADRMLDMGFFEDIETIIAATPESRQMLLFSATLDGKVATLTRTIMKNALRIEVVAEPALRDNIVQSVLWVDNRAHKDRLLSHLLNDTALEQAIVFTATKNDAAQLAFRLSQEGFSSAALHGDLPQHARIKTLGWLRSRQLRVLVATDIAARGIDVPGITHVFNYDMPKFAEDYVHRIGRTGRAGRSGIAVSLAEHAEISAVKRIERFTRQPLPINVIAGFEPRKVVHLVSTDPRKNNQSSNKYRFGRGERTYRRTPSFRNA